MKPILLIPVAGLAFGLGMAVDRGLMSTTTEPSKEGVSSENGQVATESSILDAVPANSSGSATESSQPVPGVRLPRGVDITIDELLSLTGSPMGPRMSSAVELYQRLSSMSASSLKSLAEELEGSPQMPTMYQARHQVFSALAEAHPEAAWQLAKNSKNQQTKQQLYPVLFASVAQEDLAKAKEMLAEITNPQLRAAASQGFMNSNILETEPDFLLKIAKDSGEQGHWQYHSLFSGWAAKDPIAASKAFEKLSPQAQTNAANGMAYSWAAKDPDAAFAWASTLENLQTRQNALSAVVQALAVQDPQKAIDYCESLPNGATKQQALQNVAQSYFQTDTEAAIEWIGTLSSSDRSKALSGSLYQLAQADPEAAAKLFEDTPMSNNLSHQAQQIANGLAQKSMDRAIEWVETLPNGQTRTNAVSGLLQTWAQTDPAAAAAYLDKQGLNQRNSHLGSSILSPWIVQDKEAALDWVLSHENPSVQQNLVSNLMGSWAHQDPQGAMEFLGTLEDPELKKNAARNLISSLGYQDPDTALEWIRQQSGDEQPGYVANMLSRIANNDHARAVEIYQEFLPTLTEEQRNGEFSSAASNIVSNWGQFEPKAAGDWALALPEGQARNQAVSSLANSWLRNNSMAASEWIGDLPAGPMRDQAIQPLVRTIQEDDPEAAFAWALTVSEDNQKQNLLRNVVSRWSKSDPDAAAFAVQSADLPEEMAGRILP